MSSETTPISPARFALAIADLPLSTLSLKAAELRNSIAHLDYSNEQLRPYADGTLSTLPATSQAQGQDQQTGQPDQDCVDAIRENEVVIRRMLERIELLKREVEGRGVRWEDLGGEVVKEEEGVDGIGRGGDESQEGTGTTGGRGEDQRSQAWRDGTFTTGRIVNGEVRMDGDGPVSGSGTAGRGGVNGLSNNTSSAGGVNGSRSEHGGGRLDDEALRRAVEERIRNLSANDDDDDAGMHL